MGVSLTTSTLSWEASSCDGVAQLKTRSLRHCSRSWRSGFLYYPYVPGKVIKEKTQVIQLTCDASAASRALTGLSVLGNVKLGLELLLKEIASLAQPKSEKPRRTKPASSSDLSLGSKLVEDEGKDSSTVASRLPDARAV